MAENRITQLQQQLTTAQQDLAKTQDEVIKRILYANSIDNLNKLIISLQWFQEKSTMEQSIERLNDDANQLTASVDKLKREIENREIRLASISQESERLSDERDKFAAEAAALEQTIASLQSKQSQSESQQTARIQHLEAAAESKEAEMIQLKVSTSFGLFCINKRN